MNKWRRLWFVGLLIPIFSVEAQQLPLNIKSKGSILQFYKSDQLIVEATFFSGEVPILVGFSSELVEIREGAISQQIVISALKKSSLGQLRMEARVYAGADSFAAEGSHPQKDLFSVVRTSDGPSLNSRNHAVYDRNDDWLLQGIPDQTLLISPTRNSDDSIQYHWKSVGRSFNFTFLPHYYQKHKGIRSFDPKKHKVKKERPVGWCSWYNNYEAITESEIDEMMDLFEAHRLRDYGFKVIQLDDGYQKGTQSGDGRPPEYYGGGLPSNWLEWNDKFPSGMDGYIKKAAQKGFESGIWVGSFCNSDEVAQQDPDALVKEPGNAPVSASLWLKYGWDTSQQRVIDQYITPTYEGLQSAGFSYVKIDFLRHYLYDCLNNVNLYNQNYSISTSEIIRNYMSAARDALGEDVFILSCWGVMPESVSLADGCRIAGDGFGPVSLQQYNSWNGVVWVNDPDTLLFDPYQKKKVICGDYKVPADSVLQPLLVSLSGSMMMLGGKPETFDTPAKVEGIKRSIPILPTVPGQMFDFDSSKTDLIPTIDRSSILSGKSPVATDADQKGTICPWWLMEVDRSFGHWYIASKMNWKSISTRKEELLFSDLGLPDNQEYLVYEFWSREFIGNFKNGFTVPRLKGKQSFVYSIRANLNRPQLLSSSRHISQGGVSIPLMGWNEENLTLSGETSVVGDDSTVLVFHIPEQYQLRKASVSNEEITLVKVSDSVYEIRFLSHQNKDINWSLLF